MRNITIAVIIVTLLCMPLVSSAEGTDGVQFAGPSDRVLDAFAFEDGSSLVVTTVQRDGSDYVYVVFLYPDGSTMTNWFVAPLGTNLESIIIRICHNNIQIFGQGNDAWRYVWKFPFSDEAYLPLVCQ